MSDPDVVERLGALPSLKEVPRSELEWLAAHGRLLTFEVGSLVIRKGVPLRDLFVVFSGRFTIYVDRGAGPRRVMGWSTGAVTGMLPYSRMTTPPGDAHVEKTMEALAVDRDHFPEMIRECPVFTALTVHTMLDRARGFNSSDLQNDKMISLGKLAAGLAHELNNPASATVRGAELLLSGLGDAESASRALGAAGLTEEQLGAIERLRASCLAKPFDAVLSPIEQADREDEIAGWLSGHGSDPAHAGPLAHTAVTIEALDELARGVSGRTLDAALRWIAAGCSAHALAMDIERAARRIHELVAAVKKFTHMDRLAGPEEVDVGEALRDTLMVLTSKAKSRGVAVTLNIEPDLPLVRATGGELNQVWLNLIDNALDAVGEGGRIEIDVLEEMDRVVVHVVDDGPGIPEEIMPNIFDAFFTTKPPGQGTGLGLEITRQLVRSWGGDVSVDSRPGRTDFRVSLVARPSA